MAGGVSPEKVKELLSSFLVKPNNSHEETYVEDRTNEDRDHEQDSSKTGTQSIISSGNSTNVLRSFEKFLERLDTFSALTWFGKPAELSPIICARYGWENVDSDMLQCVGCKNFLSGQLPSRQFSSESYDESLSQLKKNLLASHDKFCILAVNPCPEHFCHVPIDDPATLMSGFSERVRSLNQVQDKLPKIDETDLRELGYDLGQGGAYCKRNLLPDLDISPKPVALAFTGWTYSNSKKDVLECTMCRRQLGLWNFTAWSPSALNKEVSSEGESDGESEGGEPRTKKLKVSINVKETLNPIQEHHHWCPWIQEAALTTTLPTPSSSSSSTPAPSSSSSAHPHPGKTPATALAWIVAVRVMCPGLMDNNKGFASTMKTTSMVESLSFFRRVIKTWSSPKVQTASASSS